MTFDTAWGSYPDGAVAGILLDAQQREIATPRSVGVGAEEGSVVGPPSTALDAGAQAQAGAAQDTGGMTTASLERRLQALKKTEREPEPGPAEPEVAPEPEPESEPWEPSMLTDVGTPELKTLLSATVQHMLGMQLQSEELDGVEEACAVAKISLRHTTALTKVLSAAIVSVAAAADAAAGADDGGEEPAEGAGTAAYPLGEGHAALIASAAKWYNKQLRKTKQKQQQAAEADRSAR